MTARRPLPRTDRGLREFKVATEGYVRSSPRAQVTLVREDEFLIRLRIVDPAFHRLSNEQRIQRVWPYLENLPDDILNELSVLLLVSPKEAKSPFSRQGFEQPLNASH